jgi:hypothetical protein
MPFCITCGQQTKETKKSIKKPKPQPALYYETDESQSEEESEVEEVIPKPKKSKKPKPEIIVHEVIKEVRKPTLKQQAHYENMRKQRALKQDEKKQAKAQAKPQRIEEPEEAPAPTKSRKSYENIF